MTAPVWTPERVAEAERRWTAGESATLIGLALGLTRNTVLGKLNRLGLVGTRRTTLGFDWTAERETELTELWRAGKTTPELAAHFGVTGAIILGRCSKLGLSRGRKGENGARTAEVNRAVEARAAVSAGLPPTRFGTGDLIVKPVQPFAPDTPSAGSKPLLALRGSDCRWPYTAGEATLFCGAPQASGSSYCACHQRWSAQAMVQAMRTAAAAAEPGQQP